MAERPLVVKGMDDVEMGGRNGPIQRAMKKPIPVRVRKMREPFVVETLEGVMTGAPGDYLMEGIKGELYPCAADVFRDSYDIVDN